MFTCPVGYNKSGPLCYKPCPEGFTDEGITCLRKACPPGFPDAGLDCTKPNYINGIGKPQVCPTGLVNDASLCYQPCREDYVGVADKCYAKCPVGFTDIGISCAKPKPYGRGTGYISQSRCQNSNIGNECEKWGLLWYPTCENEFHPFGCCVCSPNCPEGWRDDGEFCYKPTYERGNGTVPNACPLGNYDDTSLCYPNCKEGYYSVGTVCWGSCPEGFKDAGVTCQKGTISKQWQTASINGELVLFIAFLLFVLFVFTAVFIRWASNSKSVVSIENPMQNTNPFISPSVNSL